MTHEKTIKRIQELVPSVMALGLKCSECDGDGFTDGHDIPQSHSGDGECLSCPVKVDCDICGGTGILGKPITLSHILLASKGVMIDTVGIFYDVKTLKALNIGCAWNLSEDNFNAQSEETKVFLGGLLIN